MRMFLSGIPVRHGGVSSSKSCSHPQCSTASNPTWQGAKTIRIPAEFFGKCMLYSIGTDCFTFRVQNADSGVAFMVVYSNIIHGGYLRLLGGPPWPRLLNLMGRILPHLRSSNRLSCYPTPFTIQSSLGRPQPNVNIDTVHG